MISNIADIFTIHDIETEIIAASIRHPMHVTEAALKGAHIATIPYKVILQLFNHPLTDKGIEAFLTDWSIAYRTIIDFLAKPIIILQTFINIDYMKLIYSCKLMKYKL